MANGNERAAWTLANTILSLLCAAILTLNAWMLQSIVALREFAAAGDRFTMHDSNVLRKGIITDIKSELPPRWLTDRVEQLAEEHDQLYNRLDNHRH